MHHLMLEQQASITVPTQLLLIACTSKLQTGHLSRLPPVFYKKKFVNALMHI
jgi:hypothetical protein